MALAHGVHRGGMIDCTTEIEPGELLGSFRRPLFFPRYRAGELGAWGLHVVPMLAARGYWGQVYPVRGAVILKGPSARGAEAWMAMLPSEIETRKVPFLPSDRRV